MPPSLRNMYKEAMNDGEIKHKPAHGNLEAWAKQGKGGGLNGAWRVGEREEGKGTEATKRTKRNNACERNGVAYMVFQLWKRSHFLANTLPPTPRLHPHLSPSLALAIVFFFLIFFSYTHLTGVFLLNAVLTVRSGEPNSHAKKGWEDFTDEVVKAINSRCTGVVFLLWGSFAQLKGSSIDKEKHRVITSSHPSPLGATKTDEPFLGSRCFSRCNEELVRLGKEPINWNLPA